MIGNYDWDLQMRQEAEKKGNTETRQWGNIYTPALKQMRGWTIEGNDVALSNR